MGRASGMYGAQERYIKGFCRETTWKRPRHRWEDNIKMDLKEVGWGGMEWIIWLRIGTGGRCL
jgi:hypothetical protein